MISAFKFGCNWRFFGVDTANFVRCRDGAGHPGSCRVRHPCYRRYQNQRLFTGEECRWCAPGDSSTSILLEDNHPSLQQFSAWKEYLIAIKNHIFSLMAINIDSLSISPIDQSQPVEPASRCPCTDAVPPRSKLENFFHSTCCFLGVDVVSHSLCETICRNLVGRLLLDPLSCSQKNPLIMQPAFRLHKTPASSL